MSSIPPRAGQPWSPMRRSIFAIAAGLALAVPLPALAEVPVTLAGSRESMVRQNRIATQLELTFFRTRAEILDHVMRGRLVHAPGNDDYDVIAAYPYARREVVTFVERLASEYRAGCGEPLVVTSMTRAAARQPANASPLSVHPAGMAVDLRVSARAECVSWIAERLLELEVEGVIDATREYRPPHFHVAVFPNAYAEYEAGIARDSTIAVELAAQLAAEPAEAEPVAVMATTTTHVTDTSTGPRSRLGRLWRGVAVFLGLIR
jgi:hypothetical protein